MVSSHLIVVLNDGHQGTSQEFLFLFYLVCGEGSVFVNKNLYTGLLSACFLSGISQFVSAIGSSITQKVIVK